MNATIKEMVEFEGSKKTMANRELVDDMVNLSLIHI